MAEPSVHKDDDFPCILRGCDKPGSPCVYTCVWSDPFLSPPPPPPPPPAESHVAPFLIATVCFLGISFLLLTTCTIILRYRFSRLRRRNSPVRPDQTPVQDDDFSDGSVVDHPIWHIATVGLQQSVIDSITAFKYYKIDGFLSDGNNNDCSVCLTEFEDGDDLRLLPKCSHAFHLSCIDTWLRSHKNCPLCRSPVVNDPEPSEGFPQGVNFSAIQLISGNLDGGQQVEIENSGHNDGGLNSVVSLDEENNGDQSSSTSNQLRERRDNLTLPIEGIRIAEIFKKNRELRILSDLGENYRFRGEDDGGVEPIKRSFSFNSVAASAIYGAMSNLSTMGSNEGCSSNTSGGGVGQEKKINVVERVSKRGSSMSGLLIKSSSIGRSLQKAPVSLKRSLSSSSKFFSFRKMVQSPHFDGFMPMWHHAACIMRKSNQIKSIDDIEGIDSLRWEDQQKIRKYVDRNSLSADTGLSVAATNRVPVAYGIEASQTSRAMCKHCGKKIMKGEVRISAKTDGQGARGLVWYHAICFVELFPSTLAESLSGWESLSPSDQAALLSAIKGKAPTSADGGPKHDGEPLKESKAKGGAKRKATGDGDEQSKTVKTEADMTMRKCASQKDTHNNSSTDADLESKLEAQSRALWALKDDLKKYVSTSELREMLEANEQSTSGSELDLRDRCADRMMFGALKKCPVCSGNLHYSGATYKCHGYLSEWSKCSYANPQPERIKGKLKIPEDTKNQYLLKWFESQKVAKPARIMPPSSTNLATGTQTTNGQHKSSKEEKLGDLRVSMAGLPKKSMEEFQSKIEGAGGEVHAKIKKDTNCLVVGGGVSHQNAEMKKARRMKIPIVREDYLVKCIERQKKLPFDLYKIEPTGESSSVVTVKVKGRSAVHESSGLQDSGHILEDGSSIFNTTLSMSDLSSGINSYYILQIIQDDKSSECYVFRKWGRVGNEKIGGSKIEEMSKSEAIQEFKRLFLEKTGNPWEAWVHKQNFQKHPGRFFPLEIDYGVNRQGPKRNVDDDKSQLAPALKELIKMLFNVETYRAAMMEFEINLSEMPLGKLSKSNIQKGFEALTQIQNLFGNSDIEHSIRENLIVDASNRFFTMIPSIHPHVIRDEDDFKSKVKMLEALQDIEIASRLVGFDVDSDDSLDDKYKKLHCDIVPLPHDSEDYRLIENYLLTTHAPTHTEWRLELEEVFALERAGEFDRFRPHREKLGNRMLLWHGSRLTNFVGILSQGLRIAPPEAPATGYMFGKGVYFADLVSKSAQYCYTDRKNPVGLMLLSEVALGQIHELRKAQYMDKPPKGKHSTKGLGKKVPDEKGFAKWRDEVVVPCGKPVDAKVRTSELMYNEYIVYDTAQVKMQFLLKVKFHYKR